MHNLKYLLALNHFTKFGPIRIKKLKKYFLNSKKIFEANESELLKAGIEQKIAKEFINTKKNIIPENLLEQLEKENIKAITIEDELYPKILKEIHTPPQLLYYKGTLKKEEENNIAIVGSRKFTSYGKQATENLVGELSKNNLNIVSGLALGIDAFAHKACIDSGGRTIAVLGSGLDNASIYPSQNKYLSEKIIKSGGAIISEFSPGTPPLRHHFPQRNRIISGLSLGILIIEAQEKSGSLITANYALEQNREVFAVPGNIYSLNSKGTNKLIKQGAQLVTDTNDIIESLGLQVTNQKEIKKIKPENFKEEKILSCLSHEEIHTDLISLKTGLDSSVINSTLIIMEMKGMVKNIGGMKYIKI